MPDSSATVFRQRNCRAAGCGTEFWICRACDRGQRYCSSECRQQARRLQRREANRRHQQSPEGRLDHRDRQRAYRKRRALARVTDQGRQASCVVARMTKAETISAFSPPELVSTDPENPPSADRRGALIFCCVCGRSEYLFVPQNRVTVSSKKELLCKRIPKRMSRLF